MAGTENLTEGLREALMSSFDQAETAQAAPPVEPKTEAADAGTEAAEKAADTSGRARDPSTGKFVKQETEAKPKDSETAAETKPASEAAEADKGAGKEADKATGTEAKPEPDKQAAATGREPPAHWSRADKEMFAAQPPAAQDFLLRRHAAMEADYTKKTGDIANLRKEYGPIDEMFRPHADALKAKGLTPGGVIRAWANVENALVQGKGVDVVTGLVRGYGIDRNALAKALGFSQPVPEPPQADPNKTNGTGGHAVQPMQLPPELIEELRTLRQGYDAIRQTNERERAAAAQAREAEVSRSIETFKGAKDAKGELLHPYYEDVEAEMTRLALAAVASKQPVPPLQELYETAVWANPSTRAALQSREKRDQEAKVAEEARAKAERARRAGSSVTGAPGSGQARAVHAERSLREELEEAAADMAG